MDGLSVAASVIAVIQIATVVGTQCMEYIKSAKNVQGELLRLVREIGGLGIVLETLKQVLDRGQELHAEHIQLRASGATYGIDQQTNELIENVEDPYLLPTLRKLSKLEKMFDDCHDRLKQLAADIELPASFKNRSKKEALIRALKWPIKEISMRSILEDISNYITLFSLALSLDETNAILDIHKITKDTHRTVQGIQHVQEEEFKRQRAKDIIQWLAAPDSSPDYAHALQKRAKNTGSWLLQHQQYLDWKLSSRSLLWLYGTVGCGKTILSSNVVEDLNNCSKEDQDMALIFFYFNMDIQTKRNSTDMLRAVIKQLFERSNGQSDVLESLYEQQISQQPLSETQLISAFHDMASVFDNVYVVLDALDECQDRNNLFEFLEEMGQWYDVNIHIFLTSRDEKDITETVEAIELEKSRIKLTAAILKEDIRNYISSRLQTDRAFNRWKKHPQVKKDIEDSLIKKSDGMFQWVVCQLEALVRCIRPLQLRKALDSLPETLYDTYAEMLDKIHEDNYEVALRMFHWLLFSKRPLSIDELAELAAMEFGDDDPTIQRFYEPTEILKICPGFLTEYNADEATGETKTLIRIAHISIREYLLSDVICKSQVSRYQVINARAHSDITKSCLLYMQLVDQPFETVDQEEFPLAGYAINNWLSHYEMVPESEGLLHRYVYEFFTNQGNTYRKWVDFHFHDSFHGHKDELRAYALKSPINIAAGLRLMPLLRKMFENKYIDTSNDIVLQDALRSSYLGVSFPRPPLPNDDVTRLLIEHGADFSGDERYRNTLQGASYYGLYDLVKAELEAGADVNSQGIKYLNALDAAVSGRISLNFLKGMPRLGEYLESIEPSCISLLLEHGANPNVESEDRRSPLFESCSSGDIVVVKLLLIHGADPKFHRLNSSRVLRFDCFTTACGRGDIRIVKLLIDYGADVHNPRALVRACQFQRMDVVRFLLEKGLNPNGSDDESVETPLQIACSNSDDVICDLLLQYGADVNLGHGNDGSPLIQAAYRGSISIMQKLIEKSVNINQVAGYLGTALNAAARAGEIEVIECLIKNGADINIRAGIFHSPLQAAISWPHSKAVVLLLKMGADIACESRYGSTLVEALNHAPQKLYEVYIELYPPRPSKSMWTAVKRPANSSSFTDFKELEIIELNSPKDKNDPAFLGSLDPM